MKILVCTPRYYPEQFKITQICEHLAKDNEVDVICNIPDYHKGKYYKGYSIFKNRKQVINNVNIYRLFTLPRGKNLIGLAFSYLSLYFSGLFKALFIKKKYDIVLNYQLSPIYIALIGNKIAKKQHIPSITYVLDFWPDSLIAGKPNINSKKVLYKIVKKQSDKAYLNSTYLWVSSLGFKQKLINLGIKSSQIEYIPNFGEEIFETKQQNQKLKLNVNKYKDKFKILYSGNIGSIQNLDLLLDISQKAKNNKCYSFIFILVGDGSYKNELTKSIKQNKLENYFDIYDEQIIENIPNFYHLTDAFYFGLDEKLSSTIPAKLCGYFAFNKPILASAFNECKETLKSYGGAVFINKNDCYDKCLYLMNNYEIIIDNIDTKYYDKNFSKENILEKIDNKIKQYI